MIGRSLTIIENKLDLGKSSLLKEKKIRKSWTTELKVCSAYLSFQGFTSLCHSQHFHLPRAAPAQILSGECTPSGTDPSSAGALQAEFPASSQFLHVFPLCRLQLQHGPFTCSKFIQSISICSSVESSKTAELVSSPQWSSMCFRGTRDSLWFSPVAAEEFLFQCMEHLLPLLLFPWCLQHCSSHIFLTFACHSCAEVLPFIKNIFPFVPLPWPRGSALPCGGSVGVGNGWPTWGIPTTSHRGHP